MFRHFKDMYFLNQLPGWKTTVCYSIKRLVTYIFNRHLWTKHCTALQIAAPRQISNCFYDNRSATASTIIVIHAILRKTIYIPYLHSAVTQLFIQIIGSRSWWFSCWHCHLDPRRLCTLSLPPFLKEKNRIRGRTEGLKHLIVPIQWGIGFDLSP